VPTCAPAGVSVSIRNQDLVRLMSAIGRWATGLGLLEKATHVPRPARSFRRFPIDRHYIAKQEIGLEGEDKIGTAAASPSLRS